MRLVVQQNSRGRLEPHVQEIPYRKQSFSLGLAGPVKACSSIRRRTQGQQRGMGLRRVYTYNVDNETSATKKPNVRKQAYGAVATMDMIRETQTAKQTT